MSFKSLSLASLHPVLSTNLLGIVDMESSQLKLINDMYSVKSSTCAFSSLVLFLSASSSIREYNNDCNGGCRAFATINI